MNDREKLIAELLEAAIEVDWYHTRGAELLREAADALAAPFEVDEAKLAEVIDREFDNYRPIYSAEGVCVGSNAARAVSKRRDEWLRGAV